MSLSNLHIFSKNTDATAATRGYEYQKLKTLETWLLNKINARKELIYCDYEEDIFQKEVENRKSMFRQIKLYSSNFSFSSEEITKSIAHFFMLYVKGDYLFDEVEFTFEANSTIAKKVKNNDADLLKKWHEEQEALSEDLLQEIVKKVKSIITEYIEGEYKKLSVNTIKKPYLQKAKNLFDNLKEENWSDFVKKIKWSFDKVSVDEAVKISIEKIESCITKLPYSIEKKDSSTILARLYFEVAKKSIENVPDNRILDGDLLDSILLSLGDIDDRWYGEVFGKWKNISSIPSFFIGEFYEVANAANHCRWNDYLNVHDKKWIYLLEEFIKSKDAPLFCVHKAIYELLWLKLRPSLNSFKPHGTLIGSEEKIRFYFSDLNAFRSPQELEEASNLLSVVKSCKAQNKVNIPEGEFKPWISELYQILTDRSESTTNPNEQCYFFDLLGFYELNLNLGLVYETNFNLGIQYFKQIIPLLEKADFYPISTLSERINQTIKILIKVGSPNHEAYIEKLEDFSVEIQPYIQKRDGNHKAANELVNRGVTYLEKNDAKYILRALDYFHKAKDLWTQEETTEGHFLALINISQLYSSISMNLAAKYYAFGALLVVVNANKPSLYNRIHEAYAFLTNADFQQGAWISAIYDLEGFLKARTDFATKAWDIETDSLLKNTLLDIAFTLSTIPQLSSQLNGFLEHLKGKLGWIYSDFYLKEWEQNFNERLNSDDKLKKIIEQKLAGPPLNDVGQERSISWKAFGSQWEIKFLNTYELNAIAEEYSAVLQIIQVELALINPDLFLIKSNIQLQIETGEQFKPPKQLPNNERYEWKVVVQKHQNFTEKEVRTLYAQITAGLMSILKNISLLPGKEFTDILHSLFKDRNLSGRTFSVHSYQKIFTQFVSKKAFEESQRSNFQPVKNLFCLPVENNVLSWCESLSHTYNEEDSKKRIQKRYINCKEKISPFLEKWKNDPDFIKFIRNLRKKGWKDWQILMAVTNFLVSVKVNQLAAKQKFKKEDDKINFFSENFKKLMQSDEKVGDKNLSVKVLERDEFRISLDQTPINILNSWSLEYHSQIPNFKAIREFLNLRFNFDKDDTPEYNPLIHIK